MRAAILLLLWVCWIGWGGRDSRAAEATPTVLTKMTDGTKRFVSSTTNMFAPKKHVTRKSGTTAIHRAKVPERPKQGFFQQLFKPEPPPPPKTVKEWMSLKQVHP